MYFSKLTITSTLILVGFVTAVRDPDSISFFRNQLILSMQIPQVVLTVTDTVTYTPPLSTSTSTKIVTVTASSSISMSNSKSSTPVKSVSCTKSTSTTKSTMTTTTSSKLTGPSETNCPVQLYYQCGGANWKGCTACVSGATCTSQNRRLRFPKFKILKCCWHCQLSTINVSLLLHRLEYDTVSSWQRSYWYFPGNLASSLALWSNFRDAGGRLFLNDFLCPLRV